MCYVDSSVNIFIHNHFSILIFHGYQVLADFLTKFLDNED